MAHILGQAFTSWLTKKLGKSAANLTISLGRDSRLSGVSLTEAVTVGITSMGSKVYNFGIASTPAMFVSTVNPELNCDGAIMLTASHLPFNRNGLKFFTLQGGLGKPDISAILTLAEQNQFELASEQGSVEEYDFISVYADGFVKQIREAVNHPEHFEQPLKGLNIILDAGNGAGGFYADRVLKPLGADTTGSQFLEPDGTFPNHIPNPEDKEAITSICQAVIDNKADFGIILIRMSIVALRWMRQAKS